jgi:hypothetical protein
MIIFAQMEAPLVRQIDDYLLEGALVTGTVCRLVAAHRDAPLERLFATVREVLSRGCVTPS